MRRLAMVAACLNMAGCGASVHPDGTKTRGRGGQASNPLALTQFDPAALRAPARPPKVFTEPLTIVSYGPVGLSAVTQLHVRFNQGVVSFGDRSTKVRIETDPKVAGRSRFVTPDLLVFEPEEDFAASTTYNVRVLNLESAAGKQAPRSPQSWRYQVPGPRPVAVEAENRSLPLAQNTRLILRYDAPLALRNVRAEIRVLSRNSPRDAYETVPCKIEIYQNDPAARSPASSEDQTSYAFVVTPERAWTPGRTITVRMSRPPTDGRAFAEPSFERSVPVHSRFGVLGAHCAGEDDDDEPNIERCQGGPLVLKFATSVDEGQFGKFVIEPRPRNFRVHRAYRNGDDGEGFYVALHGSFDDEASYRVTVPTTLEDVYGQRLTKPASRTFVFRPKPYVRMNVQDAVLKASGPATVGVVTRDVSRIRVSAFVLNEQQLIAYRRIDLSDAKAPKGALRTAVEELSTGTEDKGLASQALDLLRWTAGARGAVLVKVESLELSKGARLRERPRPSIGLYEITNMGLTAFSSLARTAVRVTHLTTAEPMQGIEVVLNQTGTPERSAKTDRDGIAEFGEGIVLEKGALFAARDASHSDHATLLFENQHGVFDFHFDSNDPIEGPKTPRNSQAQLRTGESVIGDLTTERAVYLPGDSMRIVGFTALSTPYTASNLRRIDPKTPVELALVDSDERTVVRHKTALDSQGKFWSTLRIPDKAPLGYYHVVAKVAGDALETTASIESYRVPAFEVLADVEQADPLRGETAVTSATSRYYTGEPVPIKTAKARTHCYPFGYRPPGLDYRFAVGSYLRTASLQSEEHDVSLSPAEAKSGRFAVRFSTAKLDSSMPYRCTTALAITDASYQEIGADAHFAVHPAPVYIGLEMQRRFIAQDEKTFANLRAVDIQGKRVALTSVQVSAQRVATRDETPATPQPAVRVCQIPIRATGKDGQCTLQRLAPGRYEVVAEAQIGTRTTKTRTTFIVHAKNPTVPKTPKSRGVEQLSVEPSTTAAKVGTVIRFEVKSRHERASGLLSIDHGGIRELRPFVLRNGEAELKVVADDRWVPRIYVRAVTIANDDELPDFEQAATEVDIADEQRHLEVDVNAPEHATPRQTVPIEVRVRNAASEPTAAKVSLWAVDEAVLALREHSIPDFVETFAVDRGDETRVSEEFERVTLPYSGLGLGTISTVGHGSGSGSGYGHGGGAMGSGPKQKLTRSRFETTPIFIGDADVPKSGVLRVSGVLPDNLTTYRIVALASADLVSREGPGRFGTGETRVRVAMPLLLRTAIPRLLRPGDRAEVAAIVSNLSTPSGPIDVSLTVGDPKKVVLESAQRVSHTIERGEQARFVFRIRALAEGETTFEFRARAATGYEDAERQPFSVRPGPAQVSRVADYAALSHDTRLTIPVRYPDPTSSRNVEFTVDVSSTLVGRLRDAARYLTEYPHGCLEQLSSRVIPLVALRAAHAVHPWLEVPPAEFGRSTIDALLAMQTPEGGFGYWTASDRPQLYASAYGTWVLGLLAKAGYSVDPPARERALRFLAQRLEAKENLGVPDDPNRDLERTMALHALAESGRWSKSAANAIFARRDRLPVFAHALFALALHQHDRADARIAVLMGSVLNSVAETAATARVVESTPFRYERYFDSTSRTEALVLLALLRTRPSHPAVAKLARGLLEAQRAGRWRNTQENAYALLAVSEFAALHEKATPSFVFRAALGTQTIANARFTGDKPANVRGALKVTPTSSASPSESPLVIERRGRGVAYVRLGMSWVDTQPKAEAQGLQVTTVFADTEGRPLSTTVPIGSTVLLKLTIRASTKLRYVAVNVPLAAGLESVNEALGKGKLARLRGASFSGWVSHTEHRPDRVVVYADELPQGPSTLWLPIRATTVGTFSMPSVSAEAMYTPEVFARTRPLTIVVK